MPFRVHGRDMTPKRDVPQVLAWTVFHNISL